MSRVGMEVEICARSVIFLLRCHHPRILSTLGMGAAGGLGGTVRVGETADNEGFQIPALPDIIEELKDTLRSSVLAYRDMMGRNLAALKHMARDVEAKRSMNQFLDEVPDDRSPRAVAPTKKRKKSQGYVRE
ncbi:unnamed protein product [Symbiodinium microadriaticum]|nr:unnamed protein product [Symbiodinium microadriaticum]